MANKTLLPAPAMSNRGVGRILLHIARNIREEADRFSRHGQGERFHEFASELEDCGNHLLEQNPARGPAHD